MAPGNTPRLFVILAVRGANPNESSAGKVISEPEPTTVLIVPAPIPARKSMDISNMLMHNYILKSRYLGAPLRTCEGFADKTSKSPKSQYFLSPFGHSGNN
jgi:hypothetical protein